VASWIPREISPAEDRWRIALHEAGHAVVAYLTGTRVQLVTIRGSRESLGRCFYADGLRFDEAELECVGLPVPLLPARLRRSVETRIMCVLGGTIAEELGNFWRQGYREPTSDERAAERLALTATALKPKERDLLEHSEGRPDIDVSSALSHVLAGSQTATLYLAWLAAETRGVVYSSRARRLIFALADQLLEDDVLGAARARAIFRTNDSELRLSGRASLPAGGVPTRTHDDANTPSSIESDQMRILKAGRDG
jgi:hypothetical protein